MSDPARTPSYDELWSDVYGEMQEHGPVHRHMRRILRGVLSGLAYRSAVDVGCGAGHNAGLLRAPGPLERLVGLDLSETALARARERDPRGEYVREDVQRGGLDETFDLVFSSLLLEHLADDEAALRNMRAMTGRWLVVSTMAGDFERYRAWDEQVGHLRNYARGELERKLERTGFVVQRAIYWGFPLYSPLVRRLQNRARATARLGPAGRLAAAALYPLFFLNSSRRGDLLIVLARPAGPPSATAITESASEQRGV